METKFLLPLFTCLFSLFFTHKSIGQIATLKEYYIEIKNVNTKAFAKSVDSIVKSKPNIYFFLGYKMPILFYALKTTKEVDKKEFTEWLKPLNAEVTVFEEKKLDPKFIISKKRVRLQNEKADKAKGK